MFHRISAVSLAALFAAGCLSLHATVPEEAIRYHLAKEDGGVLPAMCEHDGKRFSEGALTCMAARRMTCNADGRWVQDGTCS